VAAATGRVIVVKLLLEHGAEVDARDQENRTALDQAVLAGRTQVADLLLRHGASLEADTLLLDAARAGTRDRDIVRWLGGHGADLEARGTDGDTPLLVAVRQNNHRLVRHLIDQGADVNVRDAAGTSALVLARELGHEEIAHWLRRSGAADP
jgi:ankyrin repeat protein